MPPLRLVASLSVAVVALGLGMAGLPGLLPASRAGEATAVPAPAFAYDEPVGERAIVVLAGGCFWGVQGVFQHVEGVVNAISGYAGGTADTAHYRTVTSGRTGHAEAVELTYDPSEVDLGTLLQIFFSVAHDPTEIDRQGPDIGRHYRSAIFPRDGAQAEAARAYIAAIDAAGVFEAPVATAIEPGAAFYPAEAYHQDYMTRNPDQPYIQVYDLPKLANLRAMFGERVRAAPVLVGADEAG